MKPKCSKHSHRSAEGCLSRPSCDTAIKTPLKITLCRYKGGRLLKRTKILGETKYTAVSHVWGNANWQTIKSLGEEVLASKEKVKFMENQLPSIMENRWFWMDILCIDQKDDDAKIAVTQHIPTIFHCARKTLAVRESWGFHYCCPEATNDIKGFFLGDITSCQRLVNHYTNHPMHFPRVDEGFLSRLWPLQEIILSDTIQFIRYKGVLEGQGYTEPRRHGNISAKLFVTFHGLRSLADSWSHPANDSSWDFHNPPNDVKNFIRAFLEDRTVSRRLTGLSRHSVKINYIFDHLLSNRRAAKSRDYILAIMPQYKWYSIPVNARALTFGELFVDCCVQAKNHDVIEIGPLLTAERVGVDVLLKLPPPPTGNVPAPKCLGDLIKLFSGVHMRWYEEMSPDPLVDRAARIYPRRVIGSIDFLEMRSLISQCMSFSNTWWHTCLSFVPDAESFPDRSYDGGEFDRMKTLRDIYEMELGYVQHKDQVGRMEQLSVEISHSDIDSLILLTALISCGLGISAFDWAKENLTPLAVEFRGMSLLALAPKIADPDLDCCEESDFWLVEVQDGMIMLMGHAEDSKLASRCLFPIDSDHLLSKFVSTSIKST